MTSLFSTDASPKNIVTLDDVESAIADVTFVVHRNTTVALVDLHSGFTVVASSACVDTATFDEETGRCMALHNAREKIWELLGFQLAQSRARLSDPPAPAPEPETPASPRVVVIQLT